MPVSIPLPRAHGVGRADAPPEDGALPVAAGRGGHGQSPGGLQALQGHGPRVVQE